MTVTGPEDLPLSLLASFRLPTTESELEFLVTSGEITAGQFALLLFYHEDEALRFLYHLVRTEGPDPMQAFWADVLINKPTEPETLAWTFFTTDSLEAMFKVYYKEFKLLDIEHGDDIWT